MYTLKSSSQITIFNVLKQTVLCIALFIYLLLLLLLLLSSSSSSRLGICYCSLLLSQHLLPVTRQYSVPWQVQKQCTSVQITLVFWH